MNYIPSTPETLAPLVRPGDILAFSGTGIVSDVVRRVTGSHISHIGIVLNAEPAAQIIESTSLRGFTGVSIGSFVGRCKEYVGDVYVYPLNDANRARCRTSDFLMWLETHNGHRYDTWGAIGAALRVHLGDAQEEFCSELAAEALQHVGVLPTSVDPSLVRPCDLLQFPIFSGTYYQIGWLK